MKQIKSQKIHINTRLLALAYSLGIFSLLYSLTNLYADKLHRLRPLPNLANVIQIDIPFIDWMILPYACSLPLFITGFFIVNSYKQLQRLTHRLLLATLLGCLCFYWLPLAFNTEYYNVTLALQDTDSRWALPYQLLHTFDKPYNQLPSLHVSYALLLMVTLWYSLTSIYGKATLVILSMFIALSTVFTWQHHLPDVISGIGMAWIVWVIDCYLDRRHGSFITSSISKTNNRITKAHVTKAHVTKASIMKYLVIAVSGFLLIQIVPVLLSNKSILYTIMGYYWLLSFSSLALAYHWHKPAIFQKNNDKDKGRHTLISYLLLSPVIVIYHLMWWSASKINLVQIPSQQSIIKVNNESDIIATGKLTSSAIKNIQPMLSKYQHIIYLDMGCEIGSSFSIVNNRHSNNGINCHYLNTLMLDITEWNQQEYAIIIHYCEQLDATIMAIQEASSNEVLLDASVLIVSQCVMGWSRSVAMMACVLTYFGHSTEQINKHISTHYPKSHIDKILTNELLHTLRKK